MKAKKSLGQHFLNSPKALKDMILGGKVSKDDLVLEIGPGKGVLTQELLNIGSSVLAVEKDDDLIPYLENKFQKEIKNDKLKIIHGDILEIDLEKILLNKKYKIVANIPYYITGEIIRLFLENKNKPLSLTLLVQKEVAERMVSKDGKESVLSLSVKFFGEPKYIGTVKRGSFNPSPKVDSAIITIDKIRDADKKVENIFFNLIKTGFAHKRKKVISNLGLINKTKEIKEFFSKNKIDEQERPENIHIETWIELAKFLK